MKHNGSSPKSGTIEQCTPVHELQFPHEASEKPSLTVNGVLSRLRRYEQRFWRLYRREHCDGQASLRSIPVAAVSSPALIDERTGRTYISNSIRSSRYTIYDFLPKQLLFQCTRLNNFYFIVIGIPQAIPGFSTTGNFTTILPLLFFILLTIFKEGYDDLRRHRLDKSENRTKATILRREDCKRHCRGWLQRLMPSRWLSFFCADQSQSQDQHLEPQDTDWVAVQWQNVRVGDVVRVVRDTAFPADMVLLSTDDKASLAYVETMALDGETNLKPKQSPCALRHCTGRAAIDASKASLVIEQPNKDLYNFYGHIKEDDEIIPLSLQQVVLRGSILRNTNYALGIVINTGEDCKIRMNANHHPKAKKPHLERWSNYIVLSLIAYVVLLSIGTSIGYVFWQSRTENRSWYLSNAAVPFKQIIIGYGIMYNNIIPLALYVSLEIVKLAQMMLMSSDLNMFDEETQQRMRCNTNTILENLGQVDYVLTDKTGTLTENNMVFKALSVGGHRLSQEQIQTVTFDTATHSTVPSNSVGPRPSQLVAELSDPRCDATVAGRVRDLLLSMALCHTCLPTEAGTDGILYEASSPDELALVKAAAALGYRLSARSSTSITISKRSDGAEEADLTYTILDTIEFSSNRKRMSVLLRSPDQQIVLLSKGADDVILPRLQHSTVVMADRQVFRKSMEMQRDKERRSLQAVRAVTVNRPSVALERLRQSLDVSRSAKVSFETPRDVPLSGLSSPTRQHHQDQHRHSMETSQANEIRPCFQHLEDFATEGLRTLVYSKKCLSQEEYASWRKISSEAQSAVINRQALLDRAAETIEQSMLLLGVTAIEDRLQPGVPETIEKLRRANMHIWMLTGDKRETAISIAHSSHICCPESVLISIDASKGDLPQQLLQGLHQIDAAGSHSVAIVDGHTLSTIETSKPLTEAFYRLAIRVDSVICCRASPCQKADLTQGIRDHAAHKLVLTIGDGANDVAMIQTAHVGIGMMGREGMQAARVADYCIAQFSFLQRLLLVHGRWNYIRTAKFILNTFWKEMLFYLPQTLYQVHTGFSGSSLYENWSLTALNTLFTSLCVILPGIFEQDLRAETLLAVPELYIFGQRSRGLNMSAFLLLMASATIEGMLVWHVPLHIYGLAGYSNDEGAFALGHMVFSIAIIWTNCKLLLIDTHTKTKIILAGFVITVAGWWVWSAFLSIVYTSNISPFDVRDGFVHGFGRDLVWWCTLLLTLTILTLTDLLILAVRRYLIMSGRWPLWPATEERRFQARELEAWQEIELEGCSRP